MADGFRARSIFSFIGFHDIINSLWLSLPVTVIHKKVCEGGWVRMTRAEDRRNNEQWNLMHICSNNSSLPSDQSNCFSNLFSVSFGHSAQRFVPSVLGQSFRGLKRSWHEILKGIPIQRTSNPERVSTVQNEEMLIRDVSCFRHYVSFEWRVFVDYGQGVCMVSALWARHAQQSMRRRLSMT